MKDRMPLSKYDHLDRLGQRLAAEPSGRPLKGRALQGRGMLAAAALALGLVGAGGAAVAALSGSDGSREADDGQVLAVGGTEASTARADDGTEVFAPGDKPISAVIANKIAERVKKLDHDSVRITKDELARCRAAAKQATTESPVEADCVIVLAQQKALAGRRGR